MDASDAPSFERFSRGGGGVAIPLGAYVGGADGVRFRPNTIALLVCAIPIISTVGWAIKLIVKAAK